MPNGLPCLCTVQRIIHSDYKSIAEGEFLFDELFAHLNSYGATKAIAIAEDATRVIARAQYDQETDRVVGFVLPCDGNGLPIVDSFIASSFSAIETMFKNNEIAKFAYVYMAQALSLHVPAFCLACLGTDNRFSADEILKRWKHIYLECRKHGITIVSYGADGDSRALKAMKSSCQLLQSFDKALFKLSPSSCRRLLYTVELLVQSAKSNHSSIYSRSHPCSCQTKNQSNKTLRIHVSCQWVIMWLAFII